MALGADRTRVLWLVLSGALVELGLGIVIGIPVTIAGGRLMASQLYGVKSHDPVILGIAVAVLTVCAAVAAIIPARCAASIAPMDALRIE